MVNLVFLFSEQPISTEPQAITLGMKTLLVLILSFPTYLFGQHLQKEIGITGLRIAFLSNQRPYSSINFNPSVRFNYHLKNGLAIRLNYLLDRVNFQYPENSAISCESGFSNMLTTGFQFQWRNEKIRFYPFFDVGLFYDNLFNTYACNNNYNDTHIVKNGYSLQPGIGLKIRMLSNIWVGTELSVLHRKGKRLLKNYDFVYSFSEIKLFSPTIILSYYF